MVLLHVKRSEENQFLYETTCGTNVGELTKTLVEIHNLRLRIKRLTEYCKDLCEHGPMKNPQNQGIDHIQDEALRAEGVEVPHRGPNYKEDPLGRRTGEAPDEQYKDKIRAELDDAIQLISKDQPTRGLKLTKAMLEEKLNLIRGAVMIAYPMGLPDWDDVKMCLDDEEPLEGQASLEVMADEGQMWWANKALAYDKTLGDYLGKNEKTKVIIKMTKKGAGAPVREPTIDENTQKQMMSFYFKKQEEHKKLMENSEDDYVNSPWANPKSLKGSLIGGNDVKWRPGL